MPRTLLTLTALEARECPADVVASAGGRAVILDGDTGAEVWSRPLDPGFPGPLFVAELEGDILIGAGQGGGPRVVRFDWQTQTERWSVFVGDPNSRTGVSVAAFAGLRTQLDVRPAQLSPGDVAGVRREASRLPASVAAWLAPLIRVEVYADGRLGGQYYPARDLITIHEDMARVTLHELWHGVEDHLPAAWQDDWRARHAAFDRWETFPAGAGSLDYFQFREWEAFAESGALYAGGGHAALPAEFGEYFDDLFAAMGW